MISFRICVRSVCGVIKSDGIVCFVFWTLIFLDMFNVVSAEFDGVFSRCRNFCIAVIFFWRVCVFVMILPVTHLIAVRLDAFL